MPGQSGDTRRGVPRPRRPTMVDVAREAGVALRTVSRFVNGDPTVGEALAERVRQAIATLDFQPDERARQLRSGVTGTIGAAVRNISDAHPVLRAVDEAGRAAGLTVVAMSTDDDEKREREAVMSMCGRRMDGLIIEPIAENHQYLQPEIDSGLPVVAFDRPATGVSVDTVLTDNRGGIASAFEHLARHGHRRIAYIGDDERIYTGHERAAAFRACAARDGGSLDGMVHPGPIEPARIAAALAGLRVGPDPATAIITGNVGHHDRRRPRPRRRLRPDRPGRLRRLPARRPAASGPDGGGSGRRRDRTNHDRPAPGPPREPVPPDPDRHRPDHAHPARLRRDRPLSTFRSGNRLFTSASRSSINDADIQCLAQEPRDEAGDPPLRNAIHPLDADAVCAFYQ